MEWLWVALLFVVIFAPVIRLRVMRWRGETLSQSRGSSGAAALS